MTRDCCRAGRRARESRQQSDAHASAWRAGYFVDHSSIAARNNRGLSPMIISATTLEEEPEFSTYQKFFQVTERNQHIPKLERYEA